MTSQLFLTSVFLDEPQIRRRGKRGDLSDLGTVHRFVMNLFGDLPESDQPRASAKILFRAETLRHRPHLLIQSAVAPASEMPIRTTDASVLLAKLETRSHVRLRVVANPVQRVSKTKADRPIPHAEVDAWLRGKLAPGFSVQHIVELQPGSARVNRSTIATVDLDCVASVADADEARRMIIDGLGRRKSHGCGLVSVTPTVWHPKQET